MTSKSEPGRDGGHPLVGWTSEFQPLHCGVRRLHFSARRAAPGTRIVENKRIQTKDFIVERSNCRMSGRDPVLPSAEPETQCFFLDPETIENLSIYFDPKKTSRIVIKKILNYYHHGEKCGKLLEDDDL